MDQFIVISHSVTTGTWTHWAWCPPAKASMRACCRCSSCVDMKHSNTKYVCMRVCVMPVGPLNWNILGIFFDPTTSGFWVCVEASWCLHKYYMFLGRYMSFYRWFSIPLPKMKLDKFSMFCWGFEQCLRDFEMTELCRRGSKFNKSVKALNLYYGCGKIKI